MQKKLSKRQQQIYDFLISEVRRVGYPPSVREIGAEVGLTSSSTVHGHLDRLETKGLIRRDPTKPRAIEILGVESPLNSMEGAEVIRVPIVGKVTAGTPITAIENIEDYMPIQKNLVNSADTLFWLVISGDSMIEAGILDGDYVLVRQQQSANNGDIVIAMTDEDEATCKRFFKEKNYFRLQPENSSLEPIILENVSILGKVISLHRSTIH